MTRLNLSWCAQPLTTTPSMSTFRVVFIITVVYQVINGILNLLAPNSTADDDDYYGDGSSEQEFSIVVLIQELLGLIFGIYVLYITCTTRKFIRNKYEIPAGCCGSCEGMLLLFLVRENEAERLCLLVGTNLN